MTPTPPRKPKTEELSPGACAATGAAAWKNPFSAKPPGLVAPLAYLSCSVTQETWADTERESKSREQSTQVRTEAEQARVWARILGWRGHKGGREGGREGRGVEWGGLSRRRREKASRAALPSLATLTFLMVSPQSPHTNQGMMCA